jgi:hypothetical protein
VALWPDYPPGSAVALTSTTGTTTNTVAVVASATPHTKGSWTTLGGVTAAPFDRIQIWIKDLSFANGTDTGTLLDIGFGGSGSEVVQIENLPIGQWAAGTMHTLPLRVPAGTQISARSQSAVASKSVAIAVLGVGFTGYEETASTTACVTYGANTATSNGTALAAPASQNTKGAWTEIGTLTRQSRLLSLAPADTSFSNTQMLFDIGHGAASSEVALVSDIAAVNGTGEDIRHILQPWPASLPTGTRIVGRLQKNNSHDVDIIHMTMLAFG